MDTTRYWTWYLDRHWTWYLDIMDLSFGIFSVCLIGNPETVQTKEKPKMRMGKHQKWLEIYLQYFSETLSFLSCVEILWHFSQMSAPIVFDKINMWPTWRCTVLMPKTLGLLLTSWMTLGKFTTFLGLYIFLVGQSTLLPHLDVNLTVCATLQESKNLQWNISLSCMPSPPCHVSRKSYRMVLSSCQQEERELAYNTYIIVPLLVEVITRSPLILYNGIYNGEIFELKQLEHELFPGLGSGNHLNSLFWMISLSFWCNLTFIYCTHKPCMSL